MRFQGLTMAGALALLLFLLGGCQGANQGNVPGLLVKNSPAPDFTLQDLSGKTISLHDFKGKAVLLDFWATWCPPCRREIPHFVDMYKKYQDKGLAIVGVALDDEGTKVVKPFVEEYKVNYTIVLGTPQIQRAYGGIQGIPTTFIIDKEGRIVHSFVGYREPEEIEKKIQPLL